MGRVQVNRIIRNNQLPDQKPSPDLKGKEKKSRGDTL
jgi:hypothetical protein